MTDLSPVTRAILRAFDERYELLGPLEEHWQEVCLAAALRALADYQPEPHAEGPLSRWYMGDRTREELHHIAQELDP